MKVDPLMSMDLDNTPIAESIASLDELLQGYKKESSLLHKSFSLWKDRLRDNRLKYATNQNLVAEQKKRIAISPQIRGGLEAIQQLEHRKTLGQFEKLLEAILEDILPDRQFKVKLELTVSHKVPSLEFYVATHGTEEWENAWKNNGGAVADALSLGLRIISILRSGKRPFLLLDEADAWMAIEAMPRYVKVLTQLAVDFGLQVLMVTHHPDLLLETEEDVPVYRFTSGSHGEVICELEAGKSLPLWDPDEKGIRSIKLENVMAHSHTDIKLGQGLTVILGKNNVGKSAVANGIIALARGDSDDSIIRHHAKESKVTLEIEDGLSIELRRTKKSEKGYKVFYSLYDEHGIMLKSTNGGTTAPDWVNERLNIDLTEEMDGLDPFLLTQKDRTFLLNRPKTKRAHVLSIHMGEDVLQSMFKLENSKVSKLNDEVKAGEKVLDYYYRTIECISKHEVILDKYQDSGSLTESLDEIKELRSLYEQYKQWQHLEDKKQIFLTHFKDFGNNTNSFVKDLDDNTLSSLYEIVDNLKLCHEWFGVNSKHKVLDKVELSKDIEIPNTDDIHSLENLIEKCKLWNVSFKKKKSFAILDSLPDIDIPDTRSLDEVEALSGKCSQWSQSDKKTELFTNVLLKLKDVEAPDTDDLAFINEMSNKYKIWNHVYKKNEAFSLFEKELQDIILPEVLISDEMIANLIKWNTLKTEFNALQKEIDVEEVKLKDIEKEQNEIKVCPLCNHPLNRDTEEHIHG